ncbi:MULTISPECIES: ABC transporter substrate-binding protein [unclassified Lysobacter]|uniref:ABC transporter substrate-binding protein n=1 Tax=unclassified Lysobacter TaxID=2635362 RepID=UPI001BE8358D|nr:MULTISPECIES: ABC transporter substrate-binding protein [unclassified Lysobacter]MBT2745837.1 ABC transporter substrate-binding protein [Lysobacter sp. ISL-42]MBT2749604.1 ABC transporter substrate-binding protein [Lysobacter sp. ISL-50]MBT2778752.1 ABC transporter substrate-binding protein [Lysobacter sp. ISL-54]MBT2781347.1 ABC transporter substrate-binding protein [Lysobacter sp. ISL-52]
MKLLRLIATTALFLIASVGVVYLAPAQARPKQNERISVFESSIARQGRLVLHGSANVGLMRALILDYQRIHPGVEVRYSHLDTQDIYQRSVRSAAAQERPDLLLSASTDLQIKLVNDGYSQPYRSPQNQTLPAAARWRDEVFAYGYEPVVMVYNTQGLDAQRVPQTRSQLQKLLRESEHALRGRIALQDPRDSAVAYFIATQEEKLLGNDAGPMLTALGENQARLFKRMDTLLDQLSSGEMVVAYGVFGSYALQRIERGAPLRIVLPRDHLLLVARTALILRDAPNPAEAQRFLDHLLSARGQAILAREAKLIPARTDLPAPARIYPGLDPNSTTLRRTPLGLGFLVYLDEVKRRRFLQQWRNYLAPDSAATAAAR